MADVADTTPGNLRADDVLPRKNMPIEHAAVFWPTSDDPLFPLVGLPVPELGPPARLDRRARSRRLSLGVRSPA